MSETSSQGQASINVRRQYPETDAGGFSRADGTIAFYQRINALISPDMHVLDFGAGRGEQLMDNAVPYRTALCTLKGKVARIVGVDVDPAVLTNPFMDETAVMTIGQPLPFADASFDLIYADWVLEHVDDPVQFVDEINRLLKPGGWFCARTPNRWGMTGIATNIIPNSLHVKLLERLQPGRQAVDVFPTRYRMNTIGKIVRYFPNSRWSNHSYISNAEPPYVQKSALAMRLVQLFWRLTPSAMATNLNIFVRKR